MMVHWECASPKPN